MYRTLIVSALSCASVLLAGPAAESVRYPLVFEPNLGQAPAAVQWIARGPGYRMLLDSDGATVMIAEKAAKPSRKDPGAHGLRRADRYSAVHMKLTGGRPWKDVAGLEPTGGVSNYLLGNNPKAWRTDVPHYGRLRAKRVYDGVDMVFYSRGGSLEYDFEVAPGADPRQIRLAFDGMEDMRIDPKSGDLVLTTAGGAEVRQACPKAYQQIGNRRVQVAGGYELLERGVASFTLASYNHRRPLVIDPVVTFTTFLRGSDFDAAETVAVDNAGNSYVAGHTLSVDFPTSDASLQLNQPFEDGFVTKLSPQGTILFSTYLGGNDDDFADAIAVDATGIYVTGHTDSSDFPHQVLKQSQASFDIFVTKIFLDGNGIFYTAIVGGPNTFDAAFGIVVNPVTHEVYVTGSTSPNDVLNVDNATIYKLDAAGNLLQTAIMAGSNSETGFGVTLDHNGDVWAVGTTCSPDFPIVFPTPQPYPITQPFHCPGFIAKWDANLITLKMSRYWAPISGVAVDAANNAYVTGFADTSAFTTTPGAFQVNPPNAAAAYITKFDSAGNLLKSTYLGGTTGESGGDKIALNAAGEVYICGGTSSSDFPGGAPLTPNPTAGFLTKMTSDLSRLLSTTFLGARIAGFAILESAPPFSVPEIYTAGRRFTGGLDTQHSDAFVVKLVDDVDRWQIVTQSASTRAVSTMMLDGNNGISGTEPVALPCATTDACASTWRFFAAVDINRDGFGDSVQYNSVTGELRAWLRSSDGKGGVSGPLSLSRFCGPSDGCSQTFSPVGAGDFNHDGIGDLLWHNNTTGDFLAWLLDGAGGVTGTLKVGTNCAVACWTRTQIVGIGDFNRDGIDDIFSRDILGGRVTIQMLNGSGGVQSTQILTQACGPLDGCGLKWSAIGVADVNHDGFIDLLWVNPKTGDLQAWLLQGAAKILAIQPLSQSCPKCTQTAPPVGILRDLHIVPQVL